MLSKDLVDLCKKLGGGDREFRFQLEDDLLFCYWEFASQKLGFGFLSILGYRGKSVVGCAIGCNPYPQNKSGDGFL